MPLSTLCFTCYSGSLHVGKRFALSFPQIRDHSTDIKLVFVNAEQTDIQITVRYPGNTAETVSVPKNGKCVYFFANGKKLAHPSHGHEVNISFKLITKMLG